MSAFGNDEDLEAFITEMGMLGDDTPAHYALVGIAHCLLELVHVNRRTADALEEANRMTRIVHDVDVQELHQQQTTTT